MFPRTVTLTSGFNSRKVVPIAFLYHVRTESQILNKDTSGTMKCSILLPASVFKKNNYIVDIFHVLVLQEYWVLMESRIPLKPVLWGVGIVAHSIRSHEQTQ